MTTQEMTDVASLVDAAFDECRCETQVKPEAHEGNVAGLVVGHGCTPDKLLCAGHVRYYIEEYRPLLSTRINKFGFVVCTECEFVALSVDEFSKLYVF